MKIIIFHMIVKFWSKEILFPPTPQFSIQEKEGILQQCFAANFQQYHI